MIIAITLANFRSINEEQTLYLLADDSLKTYSQDNSGVIEHDGVLYGRNSVILDDDDVKGNGTEIRKSALLYGANASGKSNITLAFLLLQQLFTRGTFLQVSNLCKESFFMNEKESMIKVTFALQSKIYVYTVKWQSLTAKNGQLAPSITYEELQELKNENHCLVFQRDKIASSSLSQDKDVEKEYSPGQFQLQFKFGNDYLSQLGSESSRLAMSQQILAPEMVEAITAGTSTMPQVENLLSEQQREELYKYISDRMVYHATSAVKTNSLFLIHCGFMEGEGLAKNICDFFKNMIVKPAIVEPINNQIFAKDLAIAIPDYQESWASYKDIINKVCGGNIEGIKYSMSSNMQVDVMLNDGANIHKMSLPEHLSYGSTKFLIYYYFINQLVKNGGGVLIVDEVDAHFHSKLVTELFDAVHRLPCAIQIIATTHNTALLRNCGIRFELDQLWTIDRVDNQSKINSFMDYKENMREEELEDIEGTYLAGKLGGVPDISHHDFDSFKVR